MASARARFRCWCTINDAPVVLEVVAENENDARAQLQRDHFRRATLAYTAEGEWLTTRVVWANVVSLTVRRVQKVCDYV